MSAEIDALRARIEQLRAEGAARFDPPGHRFLESLLDRAIALDPGARARVIARLSPRISTFERAFASAREDAQRALDATRAIGDPPPALAAAFAAGDYRDVTRLAAAWQRDIARGGRVSSLRWTARLVDRARVRASSAGLGGPAGELARRLEQLTTAPGPRDHARRTSTRALATALSRALFRESAETAHADLAVARAFDSLPEVTGPYNAQALATRALRRLSVLSPRYLRAYLAGLAELSSLHAALEPEKPQRRKRRKAPAKA